MEEILELLWETELFRSSNQLEQRQRFIRLSCVSKWSLLISRAYIYLLKFYWICSCYILALCLTLLICKLYAYPRTESIHILPPSHFMWPHFLFGTSQKEWTYNIYYFWTLLFTITPTISVFYTLLFIK